MLWSPNCRLLYPFENQANDYSGNARHGTVSGSGVYATKPNGGRCLYFDGTGDYVATPSFGLSGTVVVFACWTRCLLNAGVQQTILADGWDSSTDGFLRLIRGTGSNALTWYYADGVGQRTLSAPNYFAAPFNDAWLYLTLVCDYTGKTTYVYRNGQLFYTSGTMTGTPVSPSGVRAKYLGSRVTGLLLTDGYLANVQLWTLATMPAAGQMLANVNRLMLGMNPIW